MQCNDEQFEVDSGVAGGGLRDGSICLHRCEGEPEVRAGGRLVFFGQEA
jgi:hypothetical protein